MRVLIAAAFAACIASPGFAADATEIDLVFKGDGGLVVRLTGDPCDLPQVEMAIVSGMPAAQVRKAHVIAGRDMRGCWAVDAENDVLVVTENGGHGWIPLQAFKANSGI